MKPINGEPVFDRRKLNAGQPRKVNSRDERRLIKQVPKRHKQDRKQDRTFCSPRIQMEAGLRDKISNNTVQRCLNQHGYNYYQSKGKCMLF